jgi:hypothetical protein
MEFNETLLPDFAEHIGKEIYFLTDYNWFRGKLLSVGKTNCTILSSAFGQPHEFKIRRDKCALPEEKVCVVWETWKGVNGRGGYRVEREKYTKERVPARNVNYQSSSWIGEGRVTEDSPGVIRPLEKRPRPRF